MRAVVVDKVNTGLILLALVLAYCIPFKLFLLSYAILGPLHYLTEIHWLKTKKFFISKAKWVVPILLFFTLCISLFSFAKIFRFLLPVNAYEFIYGTVFWANSLLLSSFVFAVLIKIFKSSVSLYVSLFVALFFGFLFKYFLPSWLSYFGLFVPTLLHVYLFTFLFMLYGFKKNENIYGKLNLILVLLVPLCIYVLPIVVTSPSSSDIAVLNESRFTQVHFVLAKLSAQSFSADFVYNSVMGRKIQVFIAFAYLYHYLNWFSKTSLIGWRKTLNARSIVVIGLIWVASLIVYWYDFSTGFMALFFLSFLHVVLEFPLNIDTIKSLLKIR